MANISEIQKKYAGKIDFLDLELIIASVIKKSREFILAHPEYKLAKSQKLKVKRYLSRRIKHEPLAYILEYKEFYGLDFKVNKNVLIPRPETELLMEKVLSYIPTTNQFSNSAILDIGTGSGNIIIALAKNIKKNKGYKFFAIDNSEKALEVAKKNASLRKVDKEINFMKSDILNKISNLTIKQFSHLIIVANLPYLSKKIYKTAPVDVKKFEPKSALYSAKEGLNHHEKTLKQIKKLLNTSHKIPCTIFLEISPEQKDRLYQLIRKLFTEAKIKFFRDLAKRWRVCEVNI